MKSCGSSALASELAALVAAGHLGLAMLMKGVFQALIAHSRLLQKASVNTGSRIFVRDDKHQDSTGV
jgi:hypothetical protein